MRPATLATSGLAASPSRGCPTRRRTGSGRKPEGSDEPLPVLRPRPSLRASLRPYSSVGRRSGINARSGNRGWVILRSTPRGAIQPFRELLLALLNRRDQVPGLREHLLV